MKLTASIGLLAAAAVLVACGRGAAARPPATAARSAVAATADTTTPTPIAPALVIPTVTPAPPRPVIVNGAVTATPAPGGPAGCPPTGPLTFRLDGTHCWMVWNLGASGGTVSSQQLLRSTDGGQTWKLVAQNGFLSALTQPVSAYGELPLSGIDVLLFLSSDDGWMGTDEPRQTIWSTHDGGTTWTPATIENPTRVTSIVCADLRDCRVTMTQATWATHDGGVTWIPAR